MESPGQNNQWHHVRVDANGLSSKSTDDNIIPLDANRPRSRLDGDQQQQLSYWPFLLLLCSLLISIGNTLLLSFVFKSMQTSDELSNFDGKIGWDEASSSNLLQIPIELQGDARLKLNSLERVSELPLELMVQFESQDNGANIDGQSVSPVKIKFIEQRSDRDRNNDNNNNHDFDSGYFALNLNATHDELMSNEDKLRKTLELGTRMLLINKINRHSKEINNKQKSINYNENNNNNNDLMINKIGDKQDFASVSKLLELDTQEASVTLPMQKQLTTTRADDNSHDLMQVRVEERLVCPHLYGSIESNLDLQARGSDLVCQANDAFLAQSKSGDAKLSFYENIELEAPEIELDARNVYIPKGLSYLDSAQPPTQDKQDHKNNNDLRQSGAIDDYEALELVSIGEQLATADSGSPE